LDDDSDEVFIFYSNIIEKRSEKIDADQNSIMKQAHKAYTELMNEKKRFLSKSNGS
jgi:hypothetical protein